MLFNSYIFIFLFLPVTLAVFHYLRLRGNFRAAIFSLTAASLVFYGWWSPKYLILIGVLIVLNYLVARAMMRVQKTSVVLACWLLGLGVAGNLSVLSYYKYANFFIDTLNDFLDLGIAIPSIILPIGISFFTFQKIAFLVDIYHGRVRQIRFLDYALFVTFFPQLIAGPITHHSEMIPQYTPDHMKTTSRSIILGVVFFVIGLSKKVILADTSARFATPCFEAAAIGMHLDFLAAWGAALSYSAQLYFDFSAYSDMAIGIGHFFGINLPLNFDSPYKSASIIEFWRRWHMTLSRFLRDYLYIPLGGNRKGRIRRYVNLLATMALGGIWHGAGWTYLVWGVLHGFYLLINHAWGMIWSKITERPPENFFLRASARMITFLAVVVAWVFFRSANLATAWDILKSMAGVNGFFLPASLSIMAPHMPQNTSPVDSGMALITAFAILGLAWLAPSTQQLTSYVGPESTSRTYSTAGAISGLRWRPSFGWALWIGFLLAASLMMFSKISEFIYFQF
jgi:alginate O-acetyltransferase complex protein AlgI